ncbi:TetR/AcrR family transcriptional regulator [Amycolatopsis rhizosphaerae]|uniref:TetR/AcrR family transcriptional regulator n=1 Tax=Amycolatopsis rhizosphaerae TaxID=2053003 RepID=A0A558DPI5_9PSEU|nr:TetR family transcriptional regulator C-terminal domain-containing protein [Amycolatopsis rhizosphaerae]TVT62951.1 TetR/AcrR family transcriptional regulator [Amycolatopsis rhizosphaerae]
MDVSPDASARAVRLAGRLFQERGYAAAGLAELVEEGGFPGKEELAVEALTTAGEYVAEALRELAVHAETPAYLVENYIALHEQMLAGSEYRQGCPIATVTLEMASESEPIRAAAEGVFERWTRTLAEYLEKHGREAEEAARLAEHIVVTVEGALLLARARQSAGPLQNATRTLIALVN